MSTTKTSDEPADKGGMTLDEVISWAMNAKELGIPGESKPTVVTKIGSGRIKKMAVEG